MRGGAAGEDTMVFDTSLLLPMPPDVCNERHAVHGDGSLRP